MADKQTGGPPVPPIPTVPTKTGGGGGGDDGPGPGDVLEPAVRAMEEDEQPVLKRRIDFLHGEADRSVLPDDYEFSFSPKTLVGSWFLRLENDDVIWKGVVVAEPAAATYLVQIAKLDEDAENVQRLIPLERMVNDDDGYDWRFYDSEAEAQDAYVTWDLAARKRAAR
jgi:hypothetical protein